MSFLRVECEKTGRNKSADPCSPIMSLCLKVSKHASLSKLPSPLWFSGNRLNIFIVMLLPNVLVAA